MRMKESLIKYYMDIAQRTSQMSRARRLKVGAIIVKDEIIFAGYNGTFPGEDNNCEHEVMVDDNQILAQLNKIADKIGDQHEVEVVIFNKKTYAFYTEVDDSNNSVRRIFKELTTKPDVIHAEKNALRKIIRSPVSSVDSVMFMTHSPCMECAKDLANAGISKLYYRTKYRTDDGIKKLIERGVDVKQI